MSPVNHVKGHTAIKIDSPEEPGQAGLRHQVAFVAAKALQCAGAVYTVGTEWAKAVIPSTVLGSLKPWLYYGKGVETDIEKKWTAVRQGDEATANVVLKAEADRIISTGILLGASSLVGAASRWFWGPTYLADIGPEQCELKTEAWSRNINRNINGCDVDINQAKPISLDQCSAAPPPICKEQTYKFRQNGITLQTECTRLDTETRQLWTLNCDKKVNFEKLPHDSWAQNVINFVSFFPAMKTLQEVPQIAVNTLASGIVSVVGKREASPEKSVEDPDWKIKLAEISMGLGEAGMISYLAYSGAFATTGVATPLFALPSVMLAPLLILPPVLMNLLAADEMDEWGNARLAELRKKLAPLEMPLPAVEVAKQVKKRIEELKIELVPLAKQLEGKMPAEEQAALLMPFKEQIEELALLQSLLVDLQELSELEQKEKQVEGLMPKKREWEELHDEGTNKIGAAAYQAIRSVAGCFMPVVGIQSAFSTLHLLSTRAITALTGEEKLARWALPVAAVALSVFAQTQLWWG